MARKDPLRGAKAVFPIHRQVGNCRAEPRGKTFGIVWCRSGQGNHGNQKRQNRSPNSFRACGRQKAVRLQRLLTQGPSPPSRNQWNLMTSRLPPSCILRALQSEGAIRGGPTRLPMATGCDGPSKQKSATTIRVRFMSSTPRQRNPPILHALVTTTCWYHCNSATYSRIPNHQLVSPSHPNPRPQGHRHLSNHWTSRGLPASRRLPGSPPSPTREGLTLTYISVSSQLPHRLITKTGHPRPADWLVLR
jgi:hypothetical protein